MYSAWIQASKVQAGEMLVWALAVSAVWALLRFLSFTQYSPDPKKCFVPCLGCFCLGDFQASAIGGFTQIPALNPISCRRIACKRRNERHHHMWNLNGENQICKTLVD